ncbi:MAG: hypothetical protein KDC47_07845 [Flavobacteriaceae bacterium]|nr:hypothetical protein [Flavobacteriaceae bacterium]
MDKVAKIFTLPVSGYFVSERPRWVTIDFGTLTSKTVPMKNKTLKQISRGEHRIFITGDWEIKKGARTIATRRDDVNVDKLVKSPKIFMGSMLKSIIVSDDYNRTEFIFSNGYQLTAINSLPDYTDWIYLTIE